MDENGAYSGALGMVTDITDRKQAEDQLLRLNEILEQRGPRDRACGVPVQATSGPCSELIEAEERERQRIATLLHEDLQQIIAGAKFTLQ